MKILIPIISLFFIPPTLVGETIKFTITFPPTTSQEIRTLFAKLGNNPSNDIFFIRPGFARVFYSQEMIDIARSESEVIPVLLSNIHHPAIGNSAIQILSDLRVKEAIPDLIKILSDRPRNDEAESLIGLSLNALAKITQHHNGYRLYRTAFRPEIVDQAIIEYSEWYRNYADKPESELLTEKTYKEITGYSSFPGFEFYLPFIPKNPEKGWEDFKKNIDNLQHITSRSS